MIWKRINGVMDRRNFFEGGDPGHPHFCYELPSAPSSYM
jgi:hypothetical protein